MHKPILKSKEHLCQPGDCHEHHRDSLQEQAHSVTILCSVVLSICFNSSWGAYNLCMLDLNRRGTWHTRTERKLVKVDQAAGVVLDFD
ncbi:MAG TPA: hypothetical protein VEC99_13020 [Clostridia bacterium]|nr:hypothetical protein [Clostridia bacterium]